MKHRYPIALLCLALLLVGCNSQQESTAHRQMVPDICGSIHNIHQAGDIYLAGQPDKDDFEVLKSRGVKTVVNLRRPQESDLNEKDIVEGLGMTYIHIPWSGADQLTDARMDAMRSALRDSERPLILHCASANRVGPAWIAFRVLDEGVPIEQAVAEAKQAGMRTPAYETKAIAYIEARR